MATATAEKLQNFPDGASGFGAYSATSAMRHPEPAHANTNVRQPANDTLAFTNADNLWLKSTGLTTTDPNSYHKIWQSDAEKGADKHHKWANTMHGRIAMRAPARMIVGAACYAGMSMHAHKAMSGYSYTYGNPGAYEAKGIMQGIAKCIDRTFGEGIKGTVNFFTHDNAKALHAVTFDSSRTVPRTLGQKAVLVTADFTAMSFGDYMTRYALELFDPNSSPKWHDEKGHFSFSKGAKDFLANVIRGVTYASGEDIAVAIPYVYATRLSGHMLDTRSPGFDHDVQRMGNNGGSFKTIAREGKLHVVGDYQLEGMTDLIKRFTFYNVGTKMYRDFYGWAQTKIEDILDRWKKGDHHIPTPRIDAQTFTPSGLFHAAGHALNYVARTTIKVTGYMLPAATLFAVLRSPQSKSRGLAVSEDGKAIYVREKDGNPKAIKPGTIGSDGADHHANYRSDDPSKASVESPFTKDYRDAFTDKYYEHSHASPPWYSRFTNPIGRMADNYALFVNRAIRGTVSKTNAASEAVIGRKIIPVNIHEDGTKYNIEKYSNIFAKASFAYFPYFALKTDVLAAEWDTERTDMGIDRTLAGIGHLNWGEFKAGVSEVRRSLMREPFTDPAREAMAQKLRWNADPEHRSNEAYQLNGIKRVHNKPVQSHPFAFVHDDLKPRKIIPDTFTQLKPRESWVAQTTPAKENAQSKPWDSWTSQEALSKFKDTDSQGRLKPRDSWTSQQAQRKFQDMDAQGQLLH